MKTPFLLVVFISIQFNSLPLYAQSEPAKLNFGLRSDFQRLDVFHNLTFQTQHDKYAINYYLGFGQAYTFSAGKPFPQIGAQFQWFWIQLQKSSGSVFSLSSHLDLCVSQMYKPIQAVYPRAQLGYGLEFKFPNSKFVFVHQGGLAYLNEFISFPTKASHSLWDFRLSLGLQYVIR